jgi:membrane-associated protease RseP (regulator of RpoE activity)
MRMFNNGDAFRWRGRLGVRIEDLRSEMADAMGDDDLKGALVLEVIEGTPAERAGIKAGDVITRVGGRDIDDTGDLTEAVRQSKGRTTITVVRRGSTRTVEAELEDQPTTRIMRRNGNLGGNTWRFHGDSDRSEEQQLREEVRQLKEEIRELKEQIRRNRD